MDEKLQRDINDILRQVEFISAEQQEALSQAAEPLAAEAEEMAPLPEQHGWQPPPPPSSQPPPPIIIYLTDAPPPLADAYEDYDQDYDSDAMESFLDEPGENEWEEREAPFPTQDAAETEEETGAAAAPSPGAPGDRPPATLHPSRQKRIGTRLLVTLSCVLLLVGAMLATVLLLPLVTASATVTIIPRAQQITSTTTITVVTGGLPSAAGSLHERHIPGRVLSSLTLSQATRVTTTGTGERPAQVAHGTITFYNASLVEQTIPAGTTISGADGTVIVTDQDAYVPAAVNLSTNGQATVLAHAVQAGPQGNIRAGDIYGPCCRLSVSAANSVFYGGQNAHSFPMVTQADLSGVVASLKTSLMQSVQAAFAAQVHADETLLTPTCTPTVTADHAVGEEATSLGVTLDETCQAEVYRTQAMRDLVTQITMQAAAAQLGAAAGYHLSGNVEVTVVQSGSDTAKGQKQGGSLTVRVKGTGVWTYQFTEEQLQHLAQQIAGKSTREAKAILLSTPGVQSVTLHLRSESETTLPRDPGQITMEQLIGLGL